MSGDLVEPGLGARDYNISVITNIKTFAGEL
jgi:hypothetical protein